MKSKQCTFLHDNTMALLSLFLSPLKKKFRKENVAKNMNSLLYLVNVALQFFFNPRGNWYHLFNLNSSSYCQFSHGWMLPLCGRMPWKLFFKHKVHEWPLILYKFQVRLLGDPPIAMRYIIETFLILKL